MNNPVRRLALLALVLLVASPVRGDFQTALDAYNAGDYETAYREWLPLAEKGTTTAQFNIGMMLERGEGREQDFKTAIEWYVRAAENGFGRAQFRLGEVYEAGQGVERDLIQARKWFGIAENSRYKGAKKRKKKLAKEMTPGEIALGDMWAREYRNARKKKN